ncbi:MAG: glycosyltransferase family 4 protein [Desulfobacterales bacterium]|nr:glycosyltransferase family 4 protein [Desulfobacterales bacterium]
MNRSGKKNILIVADVSIANVIGGAERVLYEQSVRLAQRGYGVHLMTRRLPSHGNSEAFLEGVREWRYGVNPANPLSFLMSTWQNSKKLFATLQEHNRFDAIVIHQPFSAAGVLTSRSAKEIKKTYLCLSFSFEEFISRNKTPANVSGRLLYRMQVHVRKWMEKRVLQHAAEIIVLSQFTRDKLIEVYRTSPEKISIIPGGVDLLRFKPTDHKNKIRQGLKLPDSKIMVFTVRNLVARMGLENLIEAMQSVIRNAPDIYLVIGGAGPLNGRLTKMAEQIGVNDCIRFEGFIPEETLPHYYQMADMFILPTKELEGFGLVTLEAMASGVPVLGTPVGGTKEIMGRFDSSFMFKDSTPESIADLIKEKYYIIKNKPHIWKEISKKSRSFVEENYSWDKHVEELEKHL